MSQVFTAQQLANILCCSTDALRDIPGFPRPVESTGPEGEVISGYLVEDYAAWCQSLGDASKLESRKLIGAAEAAEILGTDIAHVVQMTLRPMPRFDPLCPRPIYIGGEAAVFIREEVIAFRDRRTIMENMAGGSVH
ncbi:hypothetical protein DyAD56_16310 [Dyella sp. AD56]|uniref:hypothetical protein n=1 Tax=Dyella sp. AD56 TaxID=1528744 RepID=UPI000C81F5F0|nr:hypothetical protein [Dyella sp. AD56]PMQ04252.1 hypothetical protein DyAD56_16310 [Dyella sp. AD56]